MDPPLGLVLAASLIGALTILPLVYIVVRALGADAALWSRLWTGHIPVLLGNTIALVATTIAFTGLLGVMLAWLVERTDLPGRAIWRWVLALPLAVPAYVAAISHIIVFRRGGLLEGAYAQLMAMLGQPQPASLSPINIYSLWGATVVIGLCTFPYVYLPVAAALRGMSRTTEEAARMAGRSSWGVFREITLPALMPAIAAGALLVAMYVLSDFGTVAMLRYRTFTTAIFSQFAGQVDRAAASALSLVLILLTLPLLFGESRAAQRGRRFIGGSHWRPAKIRARPRRRWLGFVVVALVAALSLGLPLFVLGNLMMRSLFFPTEADRIWSVGSEGLWRYGVNSLIVAVAAATLATVAAFVPGYLSARYPRRLTTALLALTKAPYALPGLIVGLSFVMIFSQYAPLIYGTVVGLILGFVFRLLPQSVATNETALRGVPVRLEQAARVMGCTGREAFRRVTLPIAAPGVAASWTLVFITAMKELPTAIMLRPPGFDTLPVRVWAAASESVYTQAAPPAFLLIVLTSLALAALYARSMMVKDWRLEIRE